MHEASRGVSSGRASRGGAVLDLHAHSSERSMDSAVSADEIASLARARGLDGVCLTEHNSLWTGEEIASVGERHGMVLLPAMEINTDIGHVLVYGLSRYSHEFHDIRRLRRIVRAEGAAMSWAHPLRPGARSLDRSEVSEFFEAIEVLNGDQRDGSDGQLAELARRLDLAGTGGSDAHSAPAVGRVATSFPEPVPTLEVLVRQLRAGRCAPVDLRGR